MIYRNKANGQLLDISSKLQSDIWEPAEEPAKKARTSKKTVKKPAVKKREK